MQAATRPLPTALRKGLLLGAAIALASAFAAPAASAASKHPAHAATAKKPDHAAGAKKVAKKKAGKTAAHAKHAGKKDAGNKTAGKNGKGGKTVAKKAPRPGGPGPLADFRGQSAAPDVVQVANWVSYTRNNGQRPFILIDKKNAQVYLFEANGRLRDHAPVLLGEAVGDDNAPGIGTKPLAKIPKDEKITPAGRFFATRGPNNRGDQVIWIDYNAAISMHRMHQVSADERRAERMASPESSDNRISYGCVNVPPKFFDSVLKPTVAKYGAVIYVLPETRTPQQQFGAYDVRQGTQLAQASSRP